MSTFAYIYKGWILWGAINYAFTVSELVIVYRDAMSKVGYGYLLKTMPRHLFNTLISYIVLGPLSTVTSIKFSKAMRLFKHYMNKEVYNDLYGTGTVDTIDINSALQEEPKVWVKFHSYPDTILITFNKLTIIDHENY